MLGVSQSPYGPVRELEGAIARGELDFALAHAQEVARERRGPIELELALGLLPLTASQQPDAYDAWALRWLCAGFGSRAGPRSPRRPSWRRASPGSPPSRRRARADPGERA